MQKGMVMSVSASQSAFDGYVKDTLLLGNGSLVQGNISPLNGNSIDVPTSVAYDSRDNRIYVTNGRSLQTARSADLVSIIDGSTNKILTSVRIADPRGITYDPTNDYLYVASRPGVTILNGATGAVVDNVTLGSSSSGLVYDPSNHYLYVAGYSSSSVAIVDTSTNGLVANVTVGAYPTGVAYDSHNGNVYVNCLQSGIISVIDGTTNQVATITAIPSLLPPSPVRQVQPPYQNTAYDTATYDLYFVNYDASAFAGRIFVLDTLANTVANFTVAQGLGAIAYDPANNDLYVTTGVSPVGFIGNTVTAINPITREQLASVTVGYGPVGIVYDTQDHDLYVANSHSYSVSVISDSANIVVATDFLETYPSSIAYDSQNGVLYVANEGSYAATVFKDSTTDNIFAINTTDNSVVPVFTGLVAPTDMVYDSYTNYLYVSSIEFTISVINPSTRSIVANIIAPSTGATGDSLAYDSQDHRIYAADNGGCINNSLCNGAVQVIDDVSNTVVATIKAGASPLGLAYDPTNDEIYVTHYSIIADSKSNSVTVISGSTNSLIANITVGSQPTGIAYDPVNSDIYVADLGSNQISVISDKTNTVVATIPVNRYPQGLIYDPVNNQLLATNQFPSGSGFIQSNVVSVINATSNGLVGNFTLGYNPTDGAYDPSNGYLYVTNFQSGTLSVLASPTASAPPSISTVNCGHDLSCSVQSNATLSNIRFAGNTIHIEADGPTGAHGYANVTVPKTAMPNIDNMHVFVDSSKLTSSAVTITSNSTAYFIYFIFTFHSPVIIDVQLSTSEPASNAPTILGLDPTLFYGIVAVMIGTVVVLAFTAYRRSVNRSNKIPI